MSNPIFNQIQIKTPDSNKFDLTHDVKMSGRMGNIMPVMVMECVPGDSVKLGQDTLVRFAPIIAPVMHRLDVYCHSFFVPNRLVWENWEKFITGQAGVTIPTIEMNPALTQAEKKLADYMGVPPCPPGGNPFTVNAIPFAAYQMIYNEYYRDQNLINPVNFQLTDGPNINPELLILRKRAWEHDYFTSALPWAQKGAAVDIPLGDVKLKDSYATDPSLDPHFVTRAATIPGGNPTNMPVGEIHIAGQEVAFDPDGSLEVKPTTINELRKAFRLQEWLEKTARAGSRYIELILGHFGVRSKDERLQRPEYITGMQAPVIISEVLNTTGETSGLPQGNMAGHGVSVGNGFTGNYYATEHGYIITVMSIMPKPAYQQAVPRTYLKTDYLDYYWPEFANIGEQEIKNIELFAGTSLPNDTFGYIPRYSEYKYMPNRVAGDFRTSLDYWHCGRIFSGQPHLTQQFIECDPTDIERIFAVNTGDDNLYISVLNKLTAVRKMPVFGTPQL